VNPTTKTKLPVKKDFIPAVFISPITTRMPDGSLNVRAGKPVVLGGEDEINTAEAARILRCSVSWVGALCDRGTLLEGQDWRRIGVRGNYKIKRASVIALAGMRLEQEKAS
jgi:hypothetical protein